MLQAFITLLSLPDSRFASEDVLALLDVLVLAARFNITEEGLRYLRQWVNESGVRWGMDDDNVRELDLPATGQHTGSSASPACCWATRWTAARRMAVGAAV